MGVKLKDLIIAKPIDMEGLKGRTIGIDAYNWLYQFLSAIRDRFTGEPLRNSKGEITSHLSGLFYRTAKLIEFGVKPVYVFDGRPPDFKLKTLEQRKKIRQEAEEKWKDAVEKGEEAMKYAQASVRLTTEMKDEAKKLLDAMGASWIQAPSEGEAQISSMVKSGQLWAGASSDYDSLLFGMPKLVRNLNIVGKKKLPGKQIYVDVNPELIDLENTLTSLEITQDQLILLGILVGTDFAPGVKGIGPKTALKIVKENKTLDKIKSSIKWESDVTIEQVFDFFKNPPVEKIEIVEKRPDLVELKRMLIEDYGFGEDRINSTLEKLESAKKVASSGLNKFLK